MVRAAALGGGDEMTSLTKNAGLVAGGRASVGTLVKLEPIGKVVGGDGEVFVGPDGPWPRTILPFEPPHAAAAKPALAARNARRVIIAAPVPISRNQPS